MTSGTGVSPVNEPPSTGETPVPLFCFPRRRVLLRHDSSDGTLRIMKHALLAVLLLSTSFALTSLGCAAHGLGRHGHMLLPPNPPGADVRAMLDDISPTAMKQYVDTLVSFGTRHALSDTVSDTRGIGAARRWIKSEFERFSAESGRTGDLALQISFDSHHMGPDGNRVDVPVDIVNVVCVIPGAMPEARDRLYYVIGHYDSRNSTTMDRVGDAPGANDDASGTAVVLELARVLSKHRFDATIVCMATAAEEEGLIGATFHANAAAEQGKDIRAVLSNDIVGDPSSPFGGRYDKQVRVFSEGVPRKMEEGDLRRLQGLSSESDSPSRQLARYIAEVGVSDRLSVQAMLVNRPDRFLRGGDHTPFNKLGIAAVRFTVVEENYDRQHQDIRIENGVQYGDLPEYVDGEYLAGVARLNADAIARLANAPSSPGRVRLIVAKLTPDTTLRWERSREPDVAGYEVVWRATTSPVWTHSIDVGNVQEYTLKLSKDNNFFGVRAYDADGYRSPVVFPRAGRE